MKKPGHPCRSCGGRSHVNWKNGRKRARACQESGCLDYFHTWERDFIDDELEPLLTEVEKLIGEGNDESLYEAMKAINEVRKTL